MGICEGRVCVVTGAGRGIGREYALLLAREGASVVVNDLGGEMDGSGVPTEGPAHDVVREIRTLGGDAVANGDDVASDEGSGDRPVARAVNTTSVSGIYGNPGQTNYGAAKAGIAAFTFIASLELARYGVTVNAVAPAALTRMTEGLGMGAAPDEAREAMSPRWIAPIVGWLASEESSAVTGRVFEASGRVLGVAEGWHRGPTVEPVDDPALVGPLVEDLLARARPPADMNGADRPA